MTIDLSIRTTRFHNNKKETFFKDFYIRRNNDNTIYYMSTQFLHSYSNKKEQKQYAPNVNSSGSFENFRKCICYILGDLKDNERFTYLEVELRSYDTKTEKRFDFEFKIDLKDNKSMYSKFTQMEKLLNMVLDQNTRLKFNQELPTIDLEINDKEIASIDIEKIKNDLKSMYDEKINALESKTESIIDHELNEIRSSVSSRTKKKRGFLKKLLRKK